MVHIVESVDIIFQVKGSSFTFFARMGQILTEWATKIVVGMAERQTPHLPKFIKTYIQNTDVVLRRAMQLMAM